MSARSAECDGEREGGRAWRYGTPGYRIERVERVERVRAGGMRKDAEGLWHATSTSTVWQEARASP